MADIRNLVHEIQTSGTQQIVRIAEDLVTIVGRKQVSCNVVGRGELSSVPPKLSMEGELITPPGAIGSA